MNSDEIKSAGTKIALAVLSFYGGRWHMGADQIAALAADAGAVVSLAYGIYLHWNMKKVPDDTVKGT